jgi:hypothetical protein
MTGAVIAHRHFRGTVGSATPCTAKNTELEQTRRCGRYQRQVRVLSGMSRMNCARRWGDPGLCPADQRNTLPTESQQHSVEQIHHRKLAGTRLELIDGVWTWLVVRPWLSWSWVCEPPGEVLGGRWERW